MNSNPTDEPRPYGDEVTWQMGYFHECMSGFEHQVAAHMMAEGMAEESLVLTRMIHDRYHASKRNPFNEIECSDHYARAMASYGTFVTACGFHYHGPKGWLQFDPVITPEDFRAPFTTAEGWGTYEQKRTEESFQASIQLRYGNLQLNTWSLPFHAKGGMRLVVEVASGDGHREKLAVNIEMQEHQTLVRFENKVDLTPGHTLRVGISYPD